MTLCVCVCVCVHTRMYAHMLASDLDALAQAHPSQGQGHELVCGCPLNSGPQRSTPHTPQATSCGLGLGREYLACWLEAELIIDIKRELALLLFPKANPSVSLGPTLSSLKALPQLYSLSPLKHQFPFLHWIIPISIKHVPRFLS